jgi:Family of unknown function (DUF6282)
MAKEIILTATDIERRIDGLLGGAVDPHVHSGPSIAPRGIDHLELLQQARNAGFAATVTKDHDYSAVIAARLIRKHHPELKTKIDFLKHCPEQCGRRSQPYAVEHTSAMGRMDADTRG